MPLPLLTLAAGAGAAPPSGWKTCGGLPDSYNNTACPATQTCATMKWQPSPGSWGCCPLPNAVQCEGGYTCCPSGTKCQNKGSGWQVVSTCVPSDANDSAEPPAFPQFPSVIGADAATTGDEVCKTGPPLPYSTTPKNVLIVGDSVSIGYTPFVATAMAAQAFVQHSPWGGDGGAEETQYGARCIDNLIRAPDGTPLSPDVLMFNCKKHPPPPPPPPPPLSAKPQP
eukprot:COSAG04_NODE_284_length_18146_cov_3.266789_9_plen_226_part_00